ncbi:MAG: ComEC/Rec2 family competence protein, partial [bacterium]|nr:ComEC/Rec2 family competence protein [bacterium]
LFSIMAQSLSAIIFTAPLIFGVFGSFSVVALFANIFVVPTIPLVMLYGMVWTCIASITPFGMEVFVTALGWPLWLVLEYIIRCVEFFSSVPFASLFWGDSVMRWAVVAISYGILAVTLIWYHRKRRLYYR